jgi:hypothetical protein
MGHIAEIYLNKGVHHRLVKVRSKEGSMGPLTDALINNSQSEFTAERGTNTPTHTYTFLAA